MKVTILGPNLHGTSFTFHVHRSGCADIRRSESRFGSDEGWTIEVTTQLEVIEDVYQDILAENDDQASDYRGEFRFAPCCADLKA